MDGDLLPTEKSAHVRGRDKILAAILASLVAGLATGLGALVILPFPSLNMRVYDSVLGFSGGIMLSVATLPARAADEWHTVGG